MNSLALNPKPEVSIFIFGRWMDVSRSRAASAIRSVKTGEHAYHMPCVTREALASVCAYVAELDATSGDVTNYTHQTLALCWKEHGRKTVETILATL